MKQELFSVFDSAVGAFNRVFQAPTVEAALRTFRQIVNDPQSDFQKAPGDFTLFHVGSFDMTTGEVIKLDTPHSLGLAITFLPDIPQQEVTGA